MASLSQETGLAQLSSGVPLLGQMKDCRSLLLLPREKNQGKGTGAMLIRSKRKALTRDSHGPTRVGSGPL